MPVSQFLKVEVKAQLDYEKQVVTHKKFDLI